MAAYRRPSDESARRVDRDWLDRPRDDRHAWFDDRNSRYDSDRAGDYHDERGSRWEGGDDRVYGTYRTDDRGYHDRFREMFSRERDEAANDSYRTGTSMVGRGPKNYQRSDARIREDVCDRMTDDPILDASEIEIDVRQGEVTLTGSVTSREQKRRAEDIVERIGGVRDVTNQLRLTRDGWRSVSSQPASEASGKGTPSTSTSGSTA